MKLAVLADIHGNYVALQTVATHIERWQPDIVVVAGDIVNRGPRPRECLQFVQHKQQVDGWLTVRGNHEDYVISYARPETTPSGLEFEIYRSAYWTYQQLNSNVSALEMMPFQVDLTAPNGDNVRVVHASMNSNQDGIFPFTRDDQLRQKICLPGQTTPPLVCVGHTHWPLMRSIDDTLVVNVGAVGLPFDGNRRTAYGQFTWHRGQWQAEILRLEYDWAQAEEDFFDSGFMEEGGPLTKLVLDEFHIAQPHLFRWTQEYQAQALAGEITIEDAVHNFLAKQNRL